MNQINKFSLAISLSTADSTDIDSSKNKVYSCVHISFVNTDKWENRTVSLM